MINGSKMPDNKEIINTLERFEKDHVISYVNLDLNRKDPENSSCVVTIEKLGNQSTRETFRFSGLNSINTKGLVGLSGLSICHIKDKSNNLKVLDPDQTIEIHSLSGDDFLSAKRFLCITPKC